MMNINYLTEAQRKNLKDEIFTAKIGAFITAIILDAMIVFSLFALFERGLNIIFMSSKLIVGFLVMIGVAVTVWAIYTFALYSEETFTFESGIIIEKWVRTGKGSGHYGKIQLENGSLVEKIRIGYDNYLSEDNKVIVAIAKNHKPFCVL